MMALVVNGSILIRGDDLLFYYKFCSSRQRDCIPSTLARSRCIARTGRNAVSFLAPVILQLLELEREGLIQLPPARIHPQQLREQGKQASATTSPGGSGVARIRRDITCCGLEERA